MYIIITDDRSGFTVLPATNGTLGKEKYTKNRFYDSAIATKENQGLMETNRRHERLMGLIELMEENGGSHCIGDS